MQRGAQSRRTGLKGSEPVWLTCEPQRDGAGNVEHWTSVEGEWKTDVADANGKTTRVAAAARIKEPIALIAMRSDRALAGLNGGSGFAACGGAKNGAASRLEGKAMI